jgi:hypothetical protein
MEDGTPILVSRITSPHETQLRVVTAAGHADGEGGEDWCRCALFLV